MWPSHLNRNLSNCKVARKNIFRGFYFFAGYFDSTAMVTYSFHLYSRSSHDFTLCNTCFHYLIIHPLTDAKVRNTLYTINHEAAPVIKYYPRFSCECPHRNSSDNGWDDHLLVISFWFHPTLNFAQSKKIIITTTKTIPLAGTYCSMACTSMVTLPRSYTLESEHVTLLRARGEVYHSIVSVQCRYKV